MTSSTDQLIQAFDRIDDFIAVQRAGGGISVEALHLLQHAVGIDATARAVIRNRAGRFGSAGPVLMGIVLGLMAAELRGDVDNA